MTIGCPRWIPLLCLITLPAERLWGQEDTPQEDIRFEVQTSQTSVWPGDRIDYTVNLTVAKNIKLAMEDFEVENVSFDPLVLMGRTVSQLDQGDEIRYTFDYRLANYEIGDKGIEIPGLIFRYERGGQTEINTPTAREMKIPPLPLSVRSTLNQPADQSWIREELPSSSWLRQAWMITLAGLVGLGISCLPLGAWAVKQIPDWQARRRQLSRKKFVNRCLSQLDRVEKELSNDGSHLKEHYEALEDVLHEYALYFWEVETRGLSHRELTDSLVPQIPGQQRDTLSQVLERGRACRYSPEGQSSAEDLRQDLQQVRRLFG